MKTPPKHREPGWYVVTWNGKEFRAYWAGQYWIKGVFAMEDPSFDAARPVGIRDEFWEHVDERRIER